jgi:adenylate cyclase class IV
MEKQIEVEVRGKIKNFDRVLQHFKEKAQFIKEKDRISFIYFRDGTNVNDLSTIREDPVDLKLRVTNKQAEIVMKYGRWGTEEARKEFLFSVELEKFGSALEFFRHLGWYHGIIMDTKTFLFNFEGIEFALVRSGDLCYFEAEKLVDDSSEVKESIQEIKEICLKMNLEVFGEKEFIDLMESFNKRENRTFDFKKKSFDEVKKEFIEYF